MGALQDFLNANVIDDVTEEIAVSDRFKDKDGNILKFKVRAMTEDEYESVRKASSKTYRKGRVERTEFDNKKHNHLILMNNVIEPDFKDAESIKKLGCADPEQYISKVLLAGEIQYLSNEIMKLSGFGTNMNEIVEDVKN